MHRIISNIEKIDKEELNLLKKRIDIFTLVFIVFIAILVARLWYLQIHCGEEYSKLSENNRIRMQKLAAPRGNIHDRHGRVIVTNRPCFNIVWIREDAPDPDLVVKRLAKIFEEDISAFLDRIRVAADGPRYVPICLKEDIERKKLGYIENHRLDLPGVRVEVIPRRDYLFEDLASHLVGYLGQISRKELEESSGGIYEGGDQIGKTGIEKLYERYLCGESGRRLLEVDANGFEQCQLGVEEPLPGNDIYLTLDIDLQHAAEQAMDGKAGAVVAMEVKTGRVLALASSPPLKLKDFIGGISHKAWKSLLDDPMHPLINKTIQGQYPPGSIHKIVTAVAALSEGVVTPQTTFYCNGYLSYKKRRYRCWKGAGHGAVDIFQALKQSCDVYFYHAGQRVGVDRLAYYGNSFGLGRKTGIEMEHEKAGLIPTSDWKVRKHSEQWHEGETLSIAIGQGFNLVTPVQACRMIAALANGGVVYRPQLVEMLKDPDGQVISQFTPVIDGSVSTTPEILKLVRSALVAVVNEKRGTGRAARLKEITVAGKTGTAQVVRLSRYRNKKEDEIPYKYRDHAWFVCFAPAEDPEIAVAVVVEHGGHGGSVAGPIAKTVLSRYFDIDSET
ncbi:MAG: penicillin-binding protein 2 [Thermodesulfobacteriota bacterium]|nr:penicillin-binding protein 2 [Thermodesulfobacteriota bacterium]